MKTVIIGDFQEKVDQLLIRHRSILDSLSKYQDTNAKVNRAVTKTVTTCGCLTVSATRQNIPKDATFRDYKQYMDSHFQGDLCENCREIIENKIGDNLFYLAALCNILDLDLDEILTKEFNKLSTLGHYNLT